MLSPSEYRLLEGEHPPRDDDLAELFILASGSFEEVFLHIREEHGADLGEDMELLEDIIDSGDCLKVLHIGHARYLLNALSGDRELSLSGAFDLE